MGNEFEVDWESAPEWAIYHAFDADGTGYWYPKKPYVQHMKSSVWSVDYSISFDCLYEMSGFELEGCTTEKWRDSLTAGSSVATEDPKPADELTQAQKYPKYFKDIRGLDSIDVYGVHKLFDVVDPSGAIQHASKKLLLSGVRTGGKSKYDDIREARDTLNRWLEMEG